MKIALLFGGRGAERAVSLLSAKAVLPRLSSLGHTLLPVFVDEAGCFFLTEGKKLIAKHTSEDKLLQYRKYNCHTNGVNY